MTEDDGRRTQWLATAGTLETGASTGTFIYDAVDEAHDMLMDAEGGDRGPVIVLFSDGIGGGVGDCRLAAPDEQTRYCVGQAGDPMLCEDLPGGLGYGALREICEAIPSNTDPEYLLRLLEADSSASELMVHVVAYGSVGSHDWLRQAARVTGDRYIVAGQ